MKYRLSVGSVDGIHITEHFGSAKKFYVYDIDQESDEIIFIEEREGIQKDTLGGCNCGNGELEDGKGVSKIEKIQYLMEQVKDSDIVLVTKMGGQIEKMLIRNHMIPLTSEGEFQVALKKIMRFYKKYVFV